MGNGARSGTPPVYRCSLLAFSKTPSICTVSDAYLLSSIAVARVPAKVSDGGISLGGVLGRLVARAPPLVAFHVRKIARESRPSTPTPPPGLSVPNCGRMFANTLPGAYPVAGASGENGGELVVSCAWHLQIYNWLKTVRGLRSRPVMQISSLR